MGLSCSQARLLTLTTRKADCEYGISVDSINKMALTREMSELSQEYYSRLQSKQISYYANGKYNKMNYGYLMGYGSNWTGLINEDKNKYPLKDEKSMVLTDYKGQVVLSNDYARAITSVLGASEMDAFGRGGTFSHDNIAAIISSLLTGFYTKEQIQTVIDDKELDTVNYGNHGQGTMTREETGSTGTTDNTDTVEKEIEAVVEFYYPIFAAAASNGWTTEYNKDIEGNDDYISDALVTGSFQLATVNEVGDYDEGGSLTYFITAGLINSRTDSDVREEITAWYNAEKERISEKETMLDLHIDDLSTEVEAINTEIQSIQSLIDDAISSVLDWGSG